MAITPEEAQRRARPNQVDLKRLENKIDAMLVEKLQMGTELYVSYDFFPNQSAREAIVESYTTAGWVVKQTSDQREGSYVHIGKRGWYHRNS